GVAATAWFGGRLLGALGGFVAGMALLTSVGFFAFARYVRPETLFVAALAWGFALVLTGVAEGRRGRVAAGLAVFGVAGLAKDPIGALAPPLIIGTALALERRARPFGRWLPLPGVFACLVLGFGWWPAVERRTPGFVWYTVIDNHVLNVARARQFPDEDVPLSVAQFLAVALLGAAPWILSAGAALALVCGLFWVSDGSHFLESVLRATDVATRKSAAAGQGAPLPSFAEFQPLLGDAALVFAAGAVTSIACVLVGGGAWARPRVAAFAVLAPMLALLPLVAAALSLVSAHRAAQGMGLELVRRARPGDLIVHEGPL